MPDHADVMGRLAEAILSAETCPRYKPKDHQVERCNGPDDCAACARLAAEAVLHELGAMVDGDVLEAAAEVGYAAWQQPTEGQIAGHGMRARFVRGLRAAAGILLAGKEAEVGRVRGELEFARTMAPPNVFGAHTMAGLLSDAAEYKQRAEAAEQRVRALQDTIYRLRNPNALDQERDRFIREVGPEEPCACGHTAEHHDVRLDPDGHFERYCTIIACSCDDFEDAPVTRPASGGGETSASFVQACICRYGNGVLVLADPACPMHGKQPETTITVASTARKEEG